MKKKQNLEKESELKKQRERFIEVIDLLKTKGISQEEISKKMGKDSSYISKIRNDTIKALLDDDLRNLQDAYGVNLDYIRCKSDIKFNLFGVKQKYFDRIVEDWDTVYKGNNHYLHLRMDSTFYRFLVEYDKYKLAELDGISIDAAVEDLKAIYAGDPQIEEYVILPQNVFIELASEVEKGRKALAEILDPPDIKDLPDEWLENH